MGAGAGLGGSAGGAVRRASVRLTRGRGGAGGFACEGRRARGTGAGAAGGAGGADSVAFRATSGADGGGSLFGAGGRVESFRPRAGFGGSPAAPDAGPESAGAERGGCAGAALGLRLIRAAGSAGFALGCGLVSGGDGGGDGDGDGDGGGDGGGGGGGGVEPSESADGGASATGGGAASAAGAAGDRETLRREISSTFGFGASDFSRLVLAGAGAGLLAAFPADGSIQSTGPSTLNSHLAASSLTPGSLGIRGSSASGCAAGADDAGPAARATVACRSGG